jgi:predicted CXXCH cytochrome family protein
MKRAGLLFVASLALISFSASARFGARASSRAPRAQATAAQLPAASPPNARFAGSASCKPCHEKLYESWRQTRMANVLRDPRVHPEAVLGDFAHPTDAVTFTVKDVAFVYGSRWKQRYFAKRGDDLYVLPAQWDVKHNRWLPYHVASGTDWWTAFYGESNEQRPTGPLCDGCHSVGYDLATKQPVEWNVGCEKCHGPGSEHNAHPTKENIVNPAKLDTTRANDVCIQCHVQGRPLQLPVQGKYVDYPVGYLPGMRLADFWQFEDGKLGSASFYFYADGTAHKNRMQGNDFVQSVMYHRGMRCFNCHDVHNSQNKSNLILTGNTLCLRCHAADKQNPAGLLGTVAEHTHHAENSAGSECTACHMPEIEQTLGDNMVHAHTFNFISPKLTQQLGVPNPCTTCHTDKSNEWAIGQLRAWKSESPWRVGQ